ncbi:hypothetical protein, partial [Streptococcus agalactiae]|uniref:hypothetical protein n=1 Tax=Streptococcus agalactiae TaxID=1311 RepID=UPI001A7E7E46
IFSKIPKNNYTIFYNQFKPLPPLTPHIKSNKKIVKKLFPILQKNYIIKEFFKNRWSIYNVKK